MTYALRRSDSYGISFVGFSSEVTGRHAMDEFVIDEAEK